jgi:molybdopterin synthase catalytic subunit
MTDRKIKNIFMDGAIPPGFIADSIRNHSSKTNIGGHSIFLGQVRADVVDHKPVVAINYTAYEDMALEKMHEIREAIFAKHDLSCLHVYHSLGTVKAGEICLFVLSSSRHRRAAIDSCEEIVELIKSGLPVWGKEVFDDESYRWKENQ